MLLLKENAETQKIPVRCAPKPKHREPDHLTVEVKSSCISFDLLFVCVWGHFIRACTFFYCPNCVCLLSEKTPTLLVAMHLKAW